jgi:exosortase/archaeosortase family protein
VLIYLVNIIRIIAFNVLYYKFPEYLDILHNLFFPAVIYGFTFILWVTWVKNFSNLSKNAPS